MGTTAPSIAIRALAETDLPEAERIFLLAFGTFLGAPEPASFWSDRDYVRGRWQAPHVTAFAAEVEVNWWAPTSQPAGATSASSDR
ncbi:MULTISPECIES: hypothetical protein [Sinorhizobium]|uniref:hypothetical protein n=1 Tax=Sinorhizobium TaxID=28105 RepID=UPI00192DA489|nr:MULTISPECIES: hypothetical protein [Sinorhizobium]